MSKAGFALDLAKLPYDPAINKAIAYIHNNDIPDINTIIDKLSGRVDISIDNTIPAIGISSNGPEHALLKEIFGNPYIKINLKGIKETARVLGKDPQERELLEVALFRAAIAHEIKHIKESGILKSENRIISAVYAHLGEYEQAFRYEEADIFNERKDIIELILRKSGINPAIVGRIHKNQNSLGYKASYMEYAIMSRIAVILETIWVLAVLVFSGYGIYRLVRRLLSGKKHNRSMYRYDSNWRDLNKRNRRRRSSSPVSQVEIKQKLTEILAALKIGQEPVIDILDEVMLRGGRDYYPDGLRKDSVAYLEWVSRAVSFLGAEKRLESVFNALIRSLYPEFDLAKISSQNKYACPAHALIGYIYLALKFVPGNIAAVIYYNKDKYYHIAVGAKLQEGKISILDLTTFAKERVKPFALVELSQADKGNLPSKSIFNLTSAKKINDADKTAVVLFQGPAVEAILKYLEFNIGSASSPMSDMGYTELKEAFISDIQRSLAKYFGVSESEISIPRERVEIKNFGDGIEERIVCQVFTKKRPYFVKTSRLGDQEVPGSDALRALHLPNPNTKFITGYVYNYYLYEWIGNLNLNELPTANLSFKNFRYSYACELGRAAAAAFMIGLADRSATNLVASFAYGDRITTIVNIDLTASFAYLRKEPKDALEEQTALLKGAIAKIIENGGSGEYAHKFRDDFLECFEEQIYETRRLLAFKRNDVLKALSEATNKKNTADIIKRIESANEQLKSLTQKISDGVASSLTSSSPVVRILVVDDEFNQREILRMIFEGKGYEVEEAKTAEEALNRLQETRFDLMTVDNRMGQGMLGTELIERVVVINSSLPIIFISGTERVIETELVKNCPKPYKIEGLIQITVSLLNAAKSSSSPAGRTNGAVKDIASGLRSYHFKDNKGEEYKLITADWPLSEEDISLELFILGEREQEINNAIGKLTLSLQRNLIGIGDVNIYEHRGEGLFTLILERLKELALVGTELKLYEVRHPKTLIVINGLLPDEYIVKLDGFLLELVRENPAIELPFSIVDELHNNISQAIAFGVMIDTEELQQDAPLIRALYKSGWDKIRLATERSKNYLGREGNIVVIKAVKSSSPVKLGAAVNTRLDISSSAVLSVITSAEPQGSFVGYVLPKGRKALTDLILKMDGSLARLAEIEGITYPLNEINTKLSALLNTWKTINTIAEDKDIGEAYLIAKGQLEELGFKDLISDVCTKDTKLEIIARIREEINILRQEKGKLENEVKRFKIEEPINSQELLTYNVFRGYSKWLKGYVAYYHQMPSQQERRREVLNMISEYLQEEILSYQGLDVHGIHNLDFSEEEAKSLAGEILTDKAYVGLLESLGIIIDNSREELRLIIEGVVSYLGLKVALIKLGRIQYHYGKSIHPAKIRELEVKLSMYRDMRFESQDEDSFIKETARLENEINSLKKANRIYIEQARKGEIFEQSYRAANKIIWELFPAVRVISGKSFRLSFANAGLIILGVSLASFGIFTAIANASDLTTHNNYSVNPGDTLWKIWDMDKNIPWSDFREIVKTANSLDDDYTIYAGKAIKLPNDTQYFPEDENGISKKTAGYEYQRLISRILASGNGKNMPEGRINAGLAQAFADRLNAVYYEVPAGIKGNDYFNRIVEDIRSRYHDAVIIEVHANSHPGVILFSRDAKGKLTVMKVESQKVKKVNYKGEGIISHILDHPNIALLEFDQAKGILNLTPERFEDLMAQAEKLARVYAGDSKDRQIIIVPGHGGVNYKTSYYINEKGEKSTGPEVKLAAKQIAALKANVRTPPVLKIEPASKYTKQVSRLEKQVMPGTEAQLQADAAVEKYIKAETERMAQEEAARQAAEEKAKLEARRIAAEKEARRLAKASKKAEEVLAQPLVVRKKIEPAQPQKKETTEEALRRVFKGQKPVAKERLQVEVPKVVEKKAAEETVIPQTAAIKPVSEQKPAKPVEVVQAEAVKQKTQEQIDRAREAEIRSRPDPFAVPEKYKRPAAEEYVVKKGDNFWKIWKKEGYSARFVWSEFKSLIEKSNPSIVNINKIYPGQKILLLPISGQSDKEKNQIPPAQKIDKQEKTGNKAYRKADIVPDLQVNKATIQAKEDKSKKPVELNPLAGPAPPVITHSLQKEKDDIKPAFSVPTALRNFFGLLTNFLHNAKLDLSKSNDFAKKITEAKEQSDPKEIKLRKQLDIQANLMALREIYRQIQKANVESKDWLEEKKLTGENAKSYASREDEKTAYLLSYLLSKRVEQDKLLEQMRAMVKHNPDPDILSVIVDWAKKDRDSKEIYLRESESNFAALERTLGLEKQKALPLQEEIRSLTNNIKYQRAKVEDAREDWKEAEEYLTKIGAFRDDDFTRKTLNMKLMPFGYIADVMRFKELMEKELRKADRFNTLTKEDVPLRLRINEFMQAVVYHHLLWLEKESGKDVKQAMEKNQQLLEEFVKSGLPEMPKTEEKLPRLKIGTLVEELIRDLNNNISFQKIQQRFKDILSDLKSFTTQEDNLDKVLEIIANPRKASESTKPSDAQELNASVDMPGSGADLATEQNRAIKLEQVIGLGIEQTKKHGGKIDVLKRKLEIAQAAKELGWKDILPNLLIDITSRFNQLGHDATSLSFKPIFLIDLAKIKSSDFNQKAIDELENQVKIAIEYSTRAELVKAYISLYKTEKEEAAYNKLIGILNTISEVVKNRVNEGSAVDTDYIIIEKMTEQLKAALADSRRINKSAQEKIKFMTGDNSKDNFITGINSLEEMDKVISSIRIEEFNLNLIASNLALEKQNITTIIKKSEFLPWVTAGADIPILSSNGNNTLTFGWGINIYLWNPEGLNKYRTEKSELRIQQEQSRQLRMDLAQAQKDKEGELKEAREVLFENGLVGKNIKESAELLSVKINDYAYYLASIRDIADEFNKLKKSILVMENNRETKYLNAKIALAELGKVTAADEALFNSKHESVASLDSLAKAIEKIIERSGKFKNADEVMNKAESTSESKSSSWKANLIIGQDFVNNLDINAFTDLVSLKITYTEKGLEKKQAEIILARGKDDKQIVINNLLEEIMQGFITLQVVEDVYSAKKRVAEGLREKRDFIKGQFNKGFELESKYRESERDLAAAEIDLSDSRQQIESISTYINRLLEQ
ncbi:MAG: response regulator, partial [Candidatus Omnitrophica bacterium]|nr:response regulator [Candidatus Omnitrophota bacterium]